MPIDDFASWKDELLYTGKIVQDEDTSVDAREAQHRFIRYTKLVEQLDGSEGRDAIAALLQSIQVRFDYGAYQTTYRILGRFPDEQFFDVLVQELPNLITRQADWAGELLIGIANGQSSRWEYQISLFNNAVASATPPIRRIIVDFIRNQETSGWLKHRKGILCPNLMS